MIVALDGKGEILNYEDYNDRVKFTEAAIMLRHAPIVYGVIVYYGRGYDVWTRRGTKWAVLLYDRWKA